MWYEYLIVISLGLISLYVILDNMKINKAGVKIRKELAIAGIINILLFFVLLIYFISSPFSLSFKQWIFGILAILILSLNIIVYVRFSELRKFLKDIKEINTSKEADSNKIKQINQKISEYETSNEK